MNINTAKMQKYAGSICLKNFLIKIPRFRELLPVHQIFLDFFIAVLFSIFLQNDTLLLVVLQFRIEHVESDRIKKFFH